MIDARLHEADVIAHDEENIGLGGCCAKAGALVSADVANKASEPKYNFRTCFILVLQIVTDGSGTYESRKQKSRYPLALKNSQA